MRCLFGFHDYQFVGMFQLYDVFGNEMTFTIGVCSRCPRCQVRYVRPKSAGDVVDWALRFENAAKREEA